MKLYSSGNWFNLKNLSKLHSAVRVGNLHSEIAYPMLFQCFDSNIICPLYNEIIHP